MHPPRVEFCFPHSCEISDQIPLTKCSGGSSFQCQTPRLGSLMWGLRLSLLWESICDIIIFQLVGCPPNRYRILYFCSCAPPTISLWFLCCLWMQNIFFVKFVDCCSAVSCDWCFHMSFYSTILSPPYCL